MPKTMVVIGPTGVGKSTFCNVVSGLDPHDNSKFYVSSGGESGTNKTTAFETKWRGDKFDLTVIDTPGLCDSSGENFTNILNMVEELKKIKHVDLFVLVANGTKLDFTEDFERMILIFRLCFGPEFLEKNTIVEVTNYPLSQEEIKRRGTAEDENYVKEIITKNLQKFKNDLKINVIFIDAVHGQGGTEYERFSQEMNKLEELLTNVPPYSCERDEFNGVLALLEDILDNKEMKDEVIKSKDAHIQEKDTAIDNLKKQNQEKDTDIENLKYQLSKEENYQMKFILSGGIVQIIYGISVLISQVGL